MLKEYQFGRVDFEPSQQTALTHRDTPKTEKFCISRPVKFDEKSQIVKPAGNYPYYLLKRADYVQQVIRLVKLILIFLIRQLSYTLILQKLKNSTCPDL